MKKLIFLGIVIASIACNNESTDSPSGKDSLTTKIPDTIISQPTITTDSLTLSADEAKDDEVFSDGSKPSTWENAGIKDAVAFKRFLKQFQLWVANNDKEKVSSAVSFPLINPPVKDKAAFIANYDIYFNEKVKSAVRKQNFNQIFRNVQGAMIGSGEIWFTQKDREFVVIGINNK